MRKVILMTETGLAPGTEMFRKVLDFLFSDKNIDIGEEVECIGGFPAQNQKYLKYIPDDSIIILAVKSRYKDGWHFDVFSGKFTIRRYKKFIGCGDISPRDIWNHTCVFFDNLVNDNENVFTKFLPN